MLLRKIKKRVARPRRCKAMEKLQLYEIIFSLGFSYRDQVIFPGFDRFLAVSDHEGQVAAVMAEVFGFNHGLGWHDDGFGYRKKIGGIEKCVVGENRESIRKEHGAAGVDIVSGRAGCGGDDEAVARYSSPDVSFRRDNVRFDRHSAVDAADGNLVESLYYQCFSVRLSDAGFEAGLLDDFELLAGKHADAVLEIVLIKSAKVSPVAEIDAEDRKFGAREEIGGIEDGAVASDR